MISNPIYPDYPCITEARIAKFQPTYLMVKRHKITGLMYFCKTYQKDPIKYLGSGTYWQYHIKKYGKQHVETIWCQQFDNIYLLVEFALGFSKDEDIVTSKKWANLIPENGLDFGDNDNFKYFWLGKKLSAERCKNMSICGIKYNLTAPKRVASEETLAKQSISQKARAKREIENGIRFLVGQKHSQHAKENVKKFQVLHNGETEVLSIEQIATKFLVTVRNVYHLIERYENIPIPKGKLKGVVISFIPNT